MSNLAKLKKKAADLEQKRQLDKALPLYQQIVDGQGDGDDADVVAAHVDRELGLHGLAAVAAHGEELGSDFQQLSAAILRPHSGHELPLLQTKIVNTVQL